MTIIQAKLTPIVIDAVVKPIQISSDVREGVAGVISYNDRSGRVTGQSSDVIDALGYTPLSNTATQAREDFAVTGATSPVGSGNEIYGLTGQPNTVPGSDTGSITWTPEVTGASADFAPKNGTSSGYSFGGYYRNLMSTNGAGVTLALNTEGVWRRSPLGVWSKPLSGNYTATTYFNGVFYVGGTGVFKYSTDLGISWNDCLDTSGNPIAINASLFGLGASAGVTSTGGSYVVFSFGYYGTTFVASIPAHIYVATTTTKRFQISAD